MTGPSPRLGIEQSCRNVFFALAFGRELAAIGVFGPNFQSDAVGDQRPGVITSAFCPAPRERRQGEADSGSAGSPSIVHELSRSHLAYPPPVRSSWQSIDCWNSPTLGLALIPDVFAAP
jgi:hypothetical protein